jgi:UDP-N-acetylglucosamine 2-epimerase (non-hydrolysing)
MKVMCVIGTRPEAIKLAPVIQELQRRSLDKPLQIVVCVTGQHREMLDQVLDLFGVEPDHDLSVMADDQTPTQVASTVLARLEPILKGEQPDWVLVQGDTTTVAAASLAAFYHRIKLGHVEAGLRTWDKWHPFPEEVNRKVASAIADLHFAPTYLSRQNLLQEGVPEDNILVTGNPVIDALHWIVKQSPGNELNALLERCSAQIEDQISAPANMKKSRILSGDPSQHKILVTAHRRENFGTPLQNICKALEDLATHYGDRLCIIYPVHLNPNIWEPVHNLLDSVPNIILTSPLDYLQIVHLMQQSDLILTDSGGIQEEAPALGKPVLVLREVTERPEAIEAGTVRLVGTNRTKIFSETVKLLDNAEEYKKMTQAVNPYGDGHAAQRIVGALLGENILEFDPTELDKIHN